MPGSSLQLRASTDVVFVFGNIYLNKREVKSEGDRGKEVNV